MVVHVPGFGNPVAEYVPRSVVAPADRVYLKLTDLMLKHRIEMETASKTPEEIEDADDFHPEEVTSPDPKIPASLPEKYSDVVLAMVIRREFIKQHFKHHQTGSSSDTGDFMQIVAKSLCPCPVMNEVTLHGQFTVILAELRDFEIQRMIHVIRNGVILPNHVISGVRFFLKNVFKTVTDLKYPTTLFTEITLN